MSELLGWLEKLGLEVGVGVFQQTKYLHAFVAIHLNAGR